MPVRPLTLISKGDLLGQLREPGDHLWAVSAVWRVDPEAPADRAALRADADAENLVIFVGIGCFKCERDYSPELAAEPCPGDPDI